MKKICTLFEQHQKNRLTPGYGKDGPLPRARRSLAVFLAHIFSGLMIAVYFVAYNVE